MKKQLLLVCMALLSLFSASAATPPINSTTNGSDVWYYIKCVGREDVNKKWLTGGADGVVLTNTLFSATNDAQLWKVVTNGDGIGLVNKQYGTYMDTDRPYDAVATSLIACKTTAPATGLKFAPYVNQVAVPNGFYMVNTSATEPIIDAANSSTTFSFYSAGVGSLYRPINYGINAANINSAVVFVSPKEILLTSITAATTLLNKSTAGTSPGQFQQDDIDALSILIGEAQVVYDNVASTNSNYINAATQLDDVVALIKTKVILPTISSGSEQWYYIKAASNSAAPYLSRTAAGAVLNCKAISMTDDQLWKLVLNVAGDGFVFQNKGGEYINTDVATSVNLLTSSTIPVNGLKYKAGSESQNGLSCFLVENSVGATVNFRLHFAASVNNLTTVNDITSNWLFISSEDIYLHEFRVAITTARSFYNATLSNQGDRFGQFSAATLSTFNTVIIAQEAKDLATMTQADLIASTKALKDATTAFKCNRDVATLSSLTKIQWFRFVNAMLPTTGYAAGRAMSSNGRNLDQKLTYEVKNINSDAQLFRFELNAAKTAATTIVNKANNLYVGFNGMIVSTPTANNEFQITALDNTVFWIKPTTASPLHAAASGVEILNWNSGLGSASAWIIEFVSEENVTNLLQPYLAKRTLARQKYDEALLVSGAEIGQYTTASVSAFNTVLTAEEAKDAATMTFDQHLQGIQDLGAAMDALVVNTDINLLASTNPVADKWYRLINDMSGAGYATGKAMSSNGRLVTEPFTWETKDVASNAQLFRFKLSADKTKVAYIVNKDNSLFIAANGTMVASPTSGVEFEITQLSGGRSFWIKPTTAAPLHAQAVGAHIVNWLNGAGSASAWVFEFVKEEDATDLLATYTLAKTRANTLYTTTTGGAEYGQYATAARTNLFNVITTEEAKEASTLTPMQLYEGTLALDNAISTYNAALNTNADGNPLYKWFTLESAKFPGKFITVNPSTKAMTLTAKDNSATQLFRFEKRPNYISGTTTYTNLYDIICKSVAGTIRCENAGWDIVYNDGLNFSTGNGDFVTLGYFPWQLILGFGANGTQVSIISVAGDGVDSGDGVTMTNNSATAYDGNASWKIAFAETTLDVKANTQSGVNVYANNKMIIVTGTNAPVKAYNISGVAVDATKALSQGIYIVKVAGTTTKVVIK